MAIRGLPGSTAKSAPAPVPPKLSLFKDDRQAKAFIADEFKRSPGSFDFSVHPRSWRQFELKGSSLFALPPLRQALISTSKL